MKNKFKTYFIISFILIVTSCEVDKSVTTIYYFQNKSGSDIKAVQISLPFQDTISIADNETYSKKVTGDYVDGPFYCDSIDIIFNHIKHKMYHYGDTSSRNILEQKNYTKHQIDDNSYEMYYTFTEQDYLDADSIK